MAAGLKAGGHYFFGQLTRCAIRLKPPSVLKFFFNRHSWMVRLVGGLALLEFILLALQQRKGLPSFGPASVVFAGCGLVIYLMDWIPWYAERHGPDGRPEKLGIRLHFHKTIVPTAYLLMVGLGLRLLGVAEGWLWVFVLFFLPILYVNGILLYFHFRDPSDLTPGYFSHNFYQQDEEPPCIP